MAETHPDQDPAPLEHSDAERVTGEQADGEDAPNGSEAESEREEPGAA